MLNQSFSTIRSIDSNTGIVNCDENTTIRISNEFMKKMQNDLMKYKFIWSGYKTKRNGLGMGCTVLDNKDIENIKKCLLKQSSDEKEYNKFMFFLDNAISAKKKVFHIDNSTGVLQHGFMFCEKIPNQINYCDYKDSLIKIHDQFIMENYNVFRKVKLLWFRSNKYEEGFNYYGITIIDPKMAQELINVMKIFLKDNDSEDAEYFIGEEYDILVNVLNTAIK